MQNRFAIAAVGIATPLFLSPLSSERHPQPEKSAHQLFILHIVLRLGYIQLAYSGPRPCDA